MTTVPFFVRHPRRMRPMSVPQTASTPSTPSTDDQLAYHALNLTVLNAIPASARCILDVGCGTGSLGRELKRRQQARIIGITHSAREAQQARAHLDGVLVQDLNVFDPSELGQFDCVVCSHVLEHLY